MQHVAIALHGVMLDFIAAGSLDSTVWAQCCVRAPLPVVHYCRITPFPASTTQCSSLPGRTHRSQRSTHHNQASRRSPVVQRTHHTVLS